MIRKGTDRPVGWIIVYRGRPRRFVKVNGISYYQHRVIWTLIHGDFDPKLEIDHIDHDTLNNRVENLRLATRFENMRNQRLGKGNSTGRIGVHRDRKHGYWLAQIGAGKSRLHLGTFKTLAEASAARSAAELVLAYHPNHGKRFHVKPTEIQSSDSVVMDPK